MLVNEFVSLTALDRCDRCNAQAVAQVEKATGEPVLLFCGHCSYRYMDKVLSQGFTIRWDEAQEYYSR